MILRMNSPGLFQSACKPYVMTITTLVIEA